MVDAFLEDAKEDGIDLLVTCTLRTLAEQDQLYAQGRTIPGMRVTQARAGQSAHNYGLALDVVPMINGKPDWTGTDAIWQKVGSLGQLAGLEWFGAPGTPYLEYAHFQHRGWRLLIQAQTA